MLNSSRPGGSLILCFTRSVTLDVPRCESTEEDKVLVKRRNTRTGMRSSAALALALAFAMASTPGVADTRWREAAGFDRSALIQVGHDNVVVDPTVRRYTGMVAGLGAPDGKGQLYTFKAAPLGPRSFPLTHDDLRGWRMTVLAGKRFGEVFTVSGNSETEITVTGDKGPLTGLGEHDVFIIESVDVNGVSMFAPAGGASAPAVAGA